MNTFYKACLMAGTILSVSSPHANAQEMSTHHHHHTSSAPLSIMGDHVHDKGDWMVSYRFGRMHMDGNRRGTKSISPQTIATTISNPNAPPATLRVVPTKMDMNMHMFGAMYGVTNDLTLMAMGMYTQKDMTHITFAGATGTTERGRFTTHSSGWGDTSLSGIYNLYKAPNHNINLSLGISAPTGSIKEKDDVLTPANTTPVLRLPYAMQLGSGTWDALPGITYTGHHNKWSWGAQYDGVIRLESENRQKYRWGSKHTLTGWGGYKISDQFSVSGLIEAQTQGKIKGADTAITAPVQTADPNNYGGETIRLGAGFTFSPNRQALKGLEFGMQLDVPVYQNLNGVQLEKDWNIRSGITYRF